MRRALAVLAVFVSALIGMAQSCTHLQTNPSDSIFDTMPLWWEGWLNEDRYIYFRPIQVYDHISVCVLYETVPPLGLNLEAFIIPDEDFQRWLNGYPPRTLAYQKHDPHATNGFCVSWWGRRTVAVIVYNVWNPDFRSQDMYIKVRGEIR